MDACGIIRRISMGSNDQQRMASSGERGAFRGHKSRAELSKFYDIHEYFPLLSKLASALMAAYLRSYTRTYTGAYTGTYTTYVRRHEHLYGLYRRSIPAYISL